MIKSITLKNFFSFEEQTVRLNPKVNLLVGINGSGKSNFIKAFELLRFGINEGSVKSLINGKWKGIGKVKNFSAIDKEPIILELLTENVLADNNDKKILYRIKINDSNHAEENLSIIDGEHQLKIGNHNPKDEGLLLEGLWTLKSTEIKEFKHVIKEVLVYEDIDLEKAITYNDISDEENYNKLRPTFDNLSGLLHKMSTDENTKEIFNEIQNKINDINVNLNDIEFRVNGHNQLRIQVKDIRKNLMLDLNSISDGTLKFIVLMSIFYNPNRGNIICIEEPENNLHPDMINTIAKGIKHASQTSQMIVSTHSPFLLNAFELEDILVFENDEKNNTIVKELSQDNFGEWAEDYTVGSLWLNGLIGGKRW